MREHSRRLEDTAIWKTYEELTADSSRRDWVQQVYENAATYLKAVRDTFPNYTLHDETHVLNVLDAMAGILGDQRAKLSAGEAELLILAACLHDLGMVYTAEEVEQCLGNADRTREFLRINNPELIGRPAEEWPEDMQQWYLRWLHPFRLREALQNEGWRGLLSAWPGEAVSEDLVLAVCEAHGEPPEEFLANDAMQYSEFDHTDPIFCALLLRLADLLDFDDTRAPKVLYGHVGCNEKSQKEWKKHQASAGFRYPESPSTAKLPYRAICTNPGIEHAVRDFLDWIDDELNTCARLQRQCDQEWQRSFPFPRSVARKGIESKGYLSGDFRMTMDQAKVMELLTGEQLYDRNDVFIRELLQNAIDATLLRLEMDENFSPADARIDLWEWNDRDGNIWFRIDDQGTGMTLGMLQRYFLKIGNSYYTSQELKRDLRDHGQAGEYHSISRFGIGFLSCFLCGTFAEVSTRYFDPEKNGEEGNLKSKARIPGYGLRMQVTGLQGYFTVMSQAEQSTAKVPPMPAPEGYDVRNLERGGYRAKPGTSISIKLDPGRLGAVDLRESAKEYLCCAKVPVYYNGERIGRTEKETMDEIHTLEGENVYELTEEWKREFDVCFPACAGQYPKVYVTVVPLDTEENRMLDSMSGAFLKYEVKFEHEKRPHWQVKGQNYEIVAVPLAERSLLQLRTQNIEAYKRFLAFDFNDFIRGHAQQEVEALTAALEALPAPPASGDELGEAWRPFESERLSPDIVWKEWVDRSQMNSLDIPFQELGIPTMDSLTGGKICSEQVTYSYRGMIAGNVRAAYGTWEYGLLLLLDRELRPTVKASRSEISELPLELMVAVHGMLCTWGEDSARSPPHSSDWRAPPLSDWRKLHGTGLERWLRDNLRDAFQNRKERLGKPVLVRDNTAIKSRNFWSEADRAVPALLMAWLQDSYQMKVDYGAGQVITLTEKSPGEEAGPYDLFPPMMFCASATRASRRFLCSKNVGFRRCINVDHPYAAWLLKSALSLDKYYNRQFKQIIEALRNSDSEMIIEVCNGIRNQLLSLPNRHGIDMRVCPLLSENDFWEPADV